MKNLLHKSHIFMLYPFENILYLSNVNRLSKEVFRYKIVGIPPNGLIVVVNEDI